MFRYLLALIIAVSPCAVASAAELSLRIAGEDQSSSLLLDDTATLEVVLDLANGENFAFAGLFLDITVEGDVDIVEAFDFQPGLDAPPSIYDRSAFLEDVDALPLAAGEGFSLEDYNLSMQAEPPDGLAGPGSFVLDRVSLRPLAEGAVDISIEMGARAPSFFDSSFQLFGVATPDTPDGIAGLLYLGVGDGRTGGDGPLALEVSSEPAVNANDNDNDSSPSTGNPFCGAGMVTMLLPCLLGLAGMRRRR